MTTTEDAPVVAGAAEPQPAGPAAAGTATDVATDVATAVEDVARRAKVASRTLATATRATKDAALRALADALVAATGEIVAANAVDVERERANGMSEGLLDRLALDGPRIAAIAD